MWEVQLKSSDRHGTARARWLRVQAAQQGRVVHDEKQRDMPMTHMQVAEAATKLDAGNLALHLMIDEIEHYGAQRVVMPFVRCAKARMDCAYVVRLCLEPVEAILYAAGGSALAENERRPVSRPRCG